MKKNDNEVTKFYLNFYQMLGINYNVSSNNHFKDKIYRIVKLLAKKILKPFITPLLTYKHILEKNIISLTRENEYLKQEINILNEILIHQKSNGSLPKDNSIKNILVISPFSVFPPFGGGRAHIYGLYSALSKFFNVEILSSGLITEKKRTNYINLNLKETVIPINKRQLKIEEEVGEKSSIYLSGLSLMLDSDNESDFTRAFDEKYANADLIVLSLPYIFPIVNKRNLRNLPIIYDSHNVEFKLMQDIVVKNKSSYIENSKQIISKVYEVEKRCCKKSKLILSCSSDDRDTYLKSFDLPIEKIFLDPGGIDCIKNKFTSIEERINNKSKFNLLNKKIGVFLGSYWLPNKIAVDKIIDSAKTCQNTIFVIIGSVCSFYNTTSLPKNVCMLGEISDRLKALVLNVADFAINIVTAGSGINVKMFDYMAAGLPIITTKFGTRGFEDKDMFIIIEEDNFATIVNNFNLLDYKDMVIKARLSCEDKYDWNKIAKNLSKVIVKKIK